MSEQTTFRFSVGNIVPEIVIKETGEIFLVGLKNRKALLSGVTLFTAIGGAAEVTPFGIEQLKKLGAEFQEGSDARFLIRSDKLEEVFSFFESVNPELFEINPDRELQEELGSIELPGQKESILSQSDLDQIKFERISTVRQPLSRGQGTSARETKIPTRRLFLVFQAMMPEEVFLKIKSHPAIEIFTQEEFATTEGGACKGVAIRNDEKVLLGDNLFNC